MPTEANTFDRLPPSSIEAEQCAIASMMLDPDVCQALAVSLRPQDFFQPDNGLIFELIVDMTRRRVPVDAVLLADELV
jgi:replicative DNA helicase